MSNELWRDIDLDGIPDGPVKRFLWTALKWAVLSVMLLLMGTLITLWLINAAFAIVVALLAYIVR